MSVNSNSLHSLDIVLDAVRAERRRQDSLYPEQHLPDGTGAPRFELDATIHTLWCNEATAEGCVTWRHVLLEEVYEALAETDAVRLRAELVQVAAVAARWIEDLDSRSG